MKQNTWMVRAGEGGWRFEDFERDSIVSIGWLEMGDMSALRTREDFIRHVERSYPGAKKAWIPGSAGQAFRFVREIKVGDGVVTYSPNERAYLVGTVVGEYLYATDLSPEQPNLHKVQWRGRVNRDQLSVPTRNSLGAISTLFLLPLEAAAEIERLLIGAAVPKALPTPEPEAMVEEQVRSPVQGPARPGFRIHQGQVEPTRLGRHAGLGGRPAASDGLQDARVAARRRPRQGHCCVARRPGFRRPAHRGRGQAPHRSDWLARDTRLSRRQA